MMFGDRDRNGGHVVTIEILKVVIQKGEDYVGLRVGERLA
jgi:hypothetical protein